MSLLERYEAFLLDLDGVLYRGDEGVPGAADGVRLIRDAGRTIVFLTNNSARTPDAVVGRLEGVGISARAEEVVTSALATARLLASRDAGTAYVIGEEGLRTALEDSGLAILDGEPSEADAVVVGWDRNLDYPRLRTASVLVRRGATLVATNADATYPAPGGELWPGAGSILAAVEAAAGVRAEVVGKPQRPLFEAALERVGTPRALVVGDRLETDIAGAVDAGVDAALVLTGAAGLADLCDHNSVPEYLLSGLDGLGSDVPPARSRPATEDDAASIRALLEEAGLGTSAAALATGRFVLVPGDGYPLAVAASEVRDQQAYLHSVAVASPVRSGGIGSLVVAAAVAEARRGGAQECVLLTEDAEGFFGRLGFAPANRDALPGWMEALSRMCSDRATAMRRRIA